MTNEELRSVLFPTRFAAETMYATPDYAYIHGELAKPGVNLTLLWTEYCKRCEQAKSTPFCDKSSVGADYESHHAYPA